MGLSQALIKKMDDLVSVIGFWRACSLQMVVILVQSGAATLKKSFNKSDRNFFHLAASLAKRSVREPMQESMMDDQVDLVASSLLEQNFQQGSEVFTANLSYKNKFDSNDLTNALIKICSLTGMNHHEFNSWVKQISMSSNLYLSDKLPVNYMGMIFTAHEISALLSMIMPLVMKHYSYKENGDDKAYRLNNKLQYHINKKIPETFFLIDRRLKITQVVKKARLFWANRLQKRSWQVHHGVDPSVRYFHARMKCCYPKNNNMDFLYWIRSDESKIIDSGFVENEKLSPIMTMINIKDIIEFFRYDKGGLSGELREIIILVLSIYQEKNRVQL